MKGEQRKDCMSAWSSCGRSLLHREKRKNDAEQTRTETTSSQSTPDTSEDVTVETIMMLHMTSHLIHVGPEIITAAIFVGILGDSTNVKDRYLSAHTTLKPSYQNKLK